MALVEAKRRVLGLLAATDRLARHFAPGEAGSGESAFYSLTLTVMLAFATLIYFAFRNRFNPAAHNRLILIATIAILDAAFERWPVPVAWWGQRAAALTCTVPSLLLIMGYDYWSRGRRGRFSGLAVSEDTANAPTSSSRAPPSELPSR
jgi:hypothetical protein